MNNRDATSQGLEPIGWKQCSLCGLVYDKTKPHACDNISTFEKEVQDYLIFIYAEIQKTNELLEKILRRLPDKDLR